MAELSQVLQNGWVTILPAVYKPQSVESVSKEASVNRHQATSLKEKAFPAVSYAEHRHINVKGTKSPFDGDLTYWSERNSKLYDGLTAQILRKNHHRCEECGLKLTQDEEVHLHHIDGNHHNWSRNNLTVLHRSCHINLHNDKRSAERKTQKHINETKGAGNNPTPRTSGAGAAKAARPDLNERGEASKPPSTQPVSYSARQMLAR